MLCYCMARKVLLILVNLGRGIPYYPATLSRRCKLSSDNDNGNSCITLAEPLHGQRPKSGAPWVRKFGNLSMREILVVTSAYTNPYGLCGGGESQGNPTWGGECHLFLAGNRAVHLGNRHLSWREIPRPSSLLKKRFL